MNFIFALFFIFLQSTSFSQFTDKKTSASFLKSRHKRDACSKYTDSERREEGVLQRASNFKKECILEVVHCAKPCEYEEFVKSAKDDRKSFNDNKQYSEFDIYKTSDKSEYAAKYQKYREYFNRKVCEDPSCKENIATETPLKPTTPTRIATDVSQVVSLNAGQSVHPAEKFVKNNWIYIAIVGSMVLLLIFVALSVHFKNRSNKKTPFTKATSATKAIEFNWFRRFSQS